MDHAGRLLPPAFSFDAARCACSYSGTAKRLITAYKDGDEQRLASIIATQIVASIQQEPDWTQVSDALVAIPPTPSHLRKRGWEPLALVAKEVSRQTGLPLLAPLASAKAADQRNLDREQRALNRSKSIVLVPEGRQIVSGLDTVILLDDVLTTGATCNAAADVLKEAGVNRVLVATFARVW